MCIKNSHPVEITGSGIQFDLTLNWADGMCGVMPVFKNKRMAQKYAGKRFEILEAWIFDPDEKENN
jgi:hypothetical protein